MPKRKYVAVAIAGLIIIVATVVFFVLMGAQPPLSEGISHVVFGVGTHGDLSSEVMALSSGVRYLRNDITLVPRQVDQIANESTRYGAEYLGILDYATLPGGISNNRWNLTVWNETVVNAVENYPEIHDWEIWNEPWVSAFQTGMMNCSAANCAYNYYLITKSAYETIKRLQPNSTVVCFGGAPINDPGTYYYTKLWYDAVWGYGLSKYCDAISLHAYTNGTLVSQQAVRGLWMAGLSAYENLTGKPIWITEVGMPASSLLPNSRCIPYCSGLRQDEFLRQSFSFFEGFPYIKRVYWYDLWGLSDGRFGNDYGLLNLSDPQYGEPKAAWQTFLSFYNNSGSAR